MERTNNTDATYSMLGLKSLSLLEKLLLRNNKLLCSTSFSHMLGTAVERIGIDSRVHPGVLSIYDQEVQSYYITYILYLQFSESSQEPINAPFALPIS